LSHSARHLPFYGQQLIPAGREKGELLPRGIAGRQGRTRAFQARGPSGWEHEWTFGLLLTRPGPAVMTAVANCQVVFSQHASITRESTATDSAHAVMVAVLVDHAARESSKILDLGVDVGIQEGDHGLPPFRPPGTVIAINARVRVTWSLWFWQSAERVTG